MRKRKQPVTDRFRNMFKTLTARVLSSLNLINTAVRVLNITSNSI